MKIRNAFLSLLAAALLPAICFTLFSAIYDAGFRGWVVIIFPFVLLTTFLHAFILGLPSVLLLRRFNILNFGTSTFAGFIVGGIPTPTGAMLATWLRGEEFGGLQEVLKAISSLGVLGIIGGIAFWVVFSHLEKGETV